jgi:hypothetical protein
MVKVKFADGKTAGVHNGKWRADDKRRLELCQLISDDAPQKDFYHLDFDLYLAGEVLKVVPGEVVSNSNPHKPVKGRIY